jgi:hypothetical protein
MTPMKFWLVWVHDTPTTKHRHQSYAAARVEADRIAMLPENFGRKVYILEAINWRCNDGLPVVKL